jgi:prolyl oligopeptidase
MRILRICLLLGAAAIAAAQPPAAPKRPVIDTYHGVQVKDDYRWLEDFSNP